MKYAGRSFTLATGEKLDHVNEACKNHLITEFGRRGLVALGYSDAGHEDEIGEAARKTNLEFKKRQVRIYNETNEQRKLSRLGYQSPGKVIRQYAVELGIELLEPYTMKDEEKAAIAKSTIENEVLKLKLAAQETAMAEMKTMMEQLLAQKKEPEPPKSGVRVRNSDGKWVKE